MTKPIPCAEYRSETNTCAAGWITAFSFCSGRGVARLQRSTCQHCGSIDERNLPHCMRDEPPAHLVRDDGLPIGWPIDNEAEQ